MNKQSLLYTVVFTFVVSFVFVLFLSFANQTTAPLVERNRELARQRSILAAMGIDFTTPEEILEKFSGVEQVSRGDMTLFRTEINGQMAYAKEFVGAGLWGPIEGVLAVSGNLERALGLEIVDHNETPGLGGRITERWFKDQVRGLRLVDGVIRVGSPGDGDSDKENGQIDAVTGATRTSESMEVIFRNELRRIAEALNGGNV